PFLERTYEQARLKEQEELHNAIVEVISEQRASIPNTLFVLDIIRFELLEAKYKEIMGVVKLTDKPPIKKIEEKE
ncbi:unnamed protein product, partial [marine sediment metagenome]